PPPGPPPPIAPSPWGTIVLVYLCSLQRPAGSPAVPAHPTPPGRPPPADVVLAPYAPNEPTPSTHGVCRPWLGSTDANTCPDLNNPRQPTWSSLHRLFTPSIRTGARQDGISFTKKNSWTQSAEVGLTAGHGCCAVLPSLRSTSGSQR